MKKELVTGTIGQLIMNRLFGIDTAPDVIISKQVPIPDNMAELLNASKCVLVRSNTCPICGNKKERAF